VGRSKGIKWTNKSVLMLAKGSDPVETIERLARDLVLRARDASVPDIRNFVTRIVEMKGDQVTRTIPL
jgi:hypothetical protein